MTKAEQNRLFEDLVPLMYAMNERDKGDFRMLLSRQKDDEDLDAFSAESLQKLHAKYKPRRSKEELEARWKEMLSDRRKKQ